MSLQAVRTGDDGQVLNTALGLTGVALSGGTFTNATLITPNLLQAQITPYTATYTSDGAITIASGIALLQKAGSAGAFTLAAPGAASIRITLTTTTDFAHVVTFTGGTLWDGTAGANTTWTAAAVQGSSLTIVSISATKWNVESFNLGTIAP